MKINPSTEYVLLGALMAGPKHGYEIMQFLGSALETTWKVGTSQLYVLLKRLEQNGLLCSNLEAQDARPSKRVFALTEKGKGTFLEWLNSPVDHARDFRMEFISKLFFFHLLSLEGGPDLVARQIGLLMNTEMELRRRAEDKVGFEGLIYGFKKQMVEGLIKWLSEEAGPFMKQVHPKTSPLN